jgi:hypothetical protein
MQVCDRKNFAIPGSDLSLVFVASEKHNS